MPQSFAIQSVAVPLSDVDYFSKDLSGQGGITPAQLLDRVVSLGANDVRLIGYYGQIATPAANSYTSFLPQSAASLKTFVDAAHARGVAVTWNPMTVFKDVTAGDNTQDSHMHPSDPALWFSNFRTLVLDNARLAAAAGADRFMLFTDVEQFAFARNPDLADDMVALTAEVRQIYHGQLTSLIWTPDGTLDGFPADILKALDLVGVGLFPKLTTSTDPTLADLEAAFRHDVNGADLIANLLRAQAVLGKPMWFSDFAQSSYDGWLRGSPQKFDPTVTFVPDNSEQVLGYRAFFDVLLQYGGDWFKGFSITDLNRIDSYPSGSVPAYYSGPAAETFWGKPGEQTIRDYFTGQVSVPTVELKGTDYGETVRAQSAGAAVLRAGRGDQTLIGGAQGDTFVAANPAHGVAVHELKLTVSGNRAQGELPTFTLRVNGESLPTNYSVGSKYGDPLVSQTIRIYASGPITSIEIDATNFRSEASDGFRSMSINSITVDGASLANNGLYHPSFGSEAAFNGNMSNGGYALFNTTGLTLNAVSSVNLKANTVMDGAAGVDTVVYAGNAADFTLTKAVAGWTVLKPGAAAGEGTDTLSNIEILRFNDKSLWLGANLDTTGTSAAQTIDLALGHDSSVILNGAFVSLVNRTDGGEAHGGAGGDILRGGSLSSQLYGGAGADTVTGGGSAANYLRGEDGNDSLVGGAGFDDINGNMGNDTVSGGLGDDWAVGGKDNDLLSGDAGGDVVWGNLGNDTCSGGDGNDQVRGGQGDDSVSGGAGDDYVSGDRGNDTISGGSGADLFHGSQDAGIDRVLDFNQAEGDRVFLDPGTTYTLSQAGADTVIDMGGGHQMILVGIQMSTLTPGWIFGA